MDMNPLPGLDKPKRAFLFGLLLLALMILVTPVIAQGPVTDDEVNAIAKDLYCPVCESTPLDVCATQACADWREVIRTKLAEGQSADEIKAYFELQYGARALAEPPRSGFTLAVWILPIIAVVVGGFFFLRLLSKMRVEAAPSGASSSEPTHIGETTPIDQDPDQDDYNARIERELREM
jgi:cytochrome c-type biogenesis protein CcmH